MKIKVLNNYGGRNTDEKRILPGIYTSEDPALFGLAEYLVTNGHATYVALPQAVASEPLPEITGDGVTEERTSEPVEDEPKRHTGKRK